MTSEPRYYVYILAYPDGRPFYVGKGQGNRIFTHDATARRGHHCHKCHVIRKIWQSGKEYQRYIVFQTDDEQQALDYERELIALYGRDTLTNVTDGGEGVSNPSPEVRAKMAASHRALRKKPLPVPVDKNDPERKRRISENMKALVQTPEYKAKHGATMRSPEYKAKMRARWENPEYRERITSRQREIWSDPEFRAKHGEKVRNRLKALAQQSMSEPDTPVPPEC